MTDLDNIWDDDDVVIAGRPASVEPLFLPDQVDIDIDKVFADGLDGVENGLLDDEGDFVLEPMKRIDTEALKRAADERMRREEALLSSQHEVLPSSSPGKDVPTTKAKGKENGDKDKKKEKKKILRLDEGRLIGDDGFPQLIPDVKYFKVKGKGHEATDLKRLLQIYQFWTHRLYPKTQFKDTVERVEKLCHSRRMQSKLSTWRDEFHGKAVQNVEDDDVIDLTEIEPREPESSAPPSRPPTSPSEGANEDASPLRSYAARKTTNRRIIQDDDEDDDAMWGAFDKAAEAPPPPPVNKTLDDDDEMWAMIDEVGEAQSTTSSAPPMIQTDDDEDEEMRAIMAEMEREAELKAAAAMDVTLQPQPPEPRSFVEEDADEMYI